MSKRTIRISPSGLNSFQFCSRSAYFSRILGYKPRIQPDYFVRGEIIHKVLETHYNGIKLDQRVSVPELLDLGRNLILNSNIDVKDGEDVITNSLKQYFQYYENETWVIKDVEVPFSKVILDTDEVCIIGEGKIDLVVEQQGMTFPVDHKSRAKEEGQPTPLDNQYSFYALVTDSKIVIENEIGLQKTKAPKDKFKRQFVNYDSVMLEEFRNDLIYWVLKFDSELQREYFPGTRNNCKKCMFRPVCETNLEFRMNKLDMLFVKSESDFDLFGDA